MANRSDIHDSLNAVRDRIADAAARCKRDVDDVLLVAVTKEAPLPAVAKAVQSGHLDLGESRVGDLTQRAADLAEMLGGDGAMPPAVRWHMIGHLQRNKVKNLLPLVNMVHSIDTLRLAETIDHQAGKIGRSVPCLLEVNCSQEPQKHGVPVGAAEGLAEQVATLPNIELLGAMTMAPLCDDPEDARPTFARMAEVFDDIVRAGRVGPKFRHLSMGMSQDFEVAVEEGATIVRVGTAIFG